MTDKYFTSKIEYLFNSFGHWGESGSYFSNGARDRGRIGYDITLDEYETGRCITRNLSCGPLSSGDHLKEETRAPLVIYLCCIRYAGEPEYIVLYNVRKEP